MLRRLQANGKILIFDERICCLFSSESKSSQNQSTSIEFLGARQFVEKQLADSNANLNGLKNINALK